MSEQQQPTSAVLPAIQALRQRIEAEAPHLHVMDVYEQPHPFVRVKDTANGIIVGFSSEAEYTLYCQLILRRKGEHA